MAHGLGGVKELRLEAFAERFCDAGYGCLVFDYRHFGDSGGEPRDLIDIKRQLEDWQSAVDFAVELPECDESRVVVWGTSFGGALAIVTAANDPRVAAAIVQCPFTDGRTSSRTIDPKALIKLSVPVVRDFISSWSGSEPVRIPTSAPPGNAALMTAPDAVPGQEAMAAASGLVHEQVMVPARVGLRIPFFVPGRRVKDIQCPIFFAVCDRDTVAPPKTTVKWAKTAPQGEIRHYDTGHFDIYVGEWLDRVVADEIDFLRKHLP
jgi:pimeloyl-ACP methyl ester carboxylesterase